MHSQLEAKKRIILKNKEKTRFQGVLIFIISSFSISLVSLNVNYLKNIFISDVSFFLIIGGIMGVVISPLMIASPISGENYAFLNILKALEIEKSFLINEKLSEEKKELLNDAYKYLIKAADELERNSSFSSNIAIWNVKNKEIEKNFVQNIKMKIAPAIKDNKFPTNWLEELALLFTESNTERIDSFNKKIEENFTKYELNNGDSFYGKIKASKYGWMIMPSFYSIVVISIILIGGSLVTGTSMNELFNQHYFELCAIGVAVFIGVRSSPNMLSQASK